MTSHSHEEALIIEGYLVCLLGDLAACRAIEIDDDVRDVLVGQPSDIYEWMT